VDSGSDVRVGFLRRHSTYLDGLRQRLSSVSRESEPFEPLDESTQHYFEQFYLPAAAASGSGCSLSVREVSFDTNQVSLDTH
jgi:hypothetical protein